MKNNTAFKLLICSFILLISVAFVKPAKTKRVVFLGDSITQAGAGVGGYISLMRDALTGAGQGNAFELIGAGISGNKVPDLQKRLEKDVLSKNPDVVFIYIGINDVWHWERNNGTSKENYEAGLNDIIKQLKAKKARVIICTPTVIGEKHDGSNVQDAMLEEYAAISRKVAQDNKLELCDLRKAFIDYLKAKNKDNAEKGIFTTDRVHLNAAGNAFLALQMMPYLAKK